MAGKITNGLLPHIISDIYIGDSLENGKKKLTDFC
jgi:hypothetical protein